MEYNDFINEQAKNILFQAKAEHEKSGLTVIEFLARRIAMLEHAVSKQNILKYDGRSYQNRNSYKYPILEMERGQSFFVEMDRNYKGTITCMQASIIQSCKSVMKRENKNWAIKTKQYASPKGIEVTRIV